MPHTVREATRLLALAQLHSSKGSHTASLECLLRANVLHASRLPRGVLLAEARKASTAARAQLHDRLVCLARRTSNLEADSKQTTDWPAVLAALSDLLSKMAPTSSPSGEHTSRREGSGWLPESATENLRLDDGLLNNKFPGRPSPAGRAVDVAQKVV